MSTTDVRRGGAAPGPAPLPVDAMAEPGSAAGRLALPQFPFLGLLSEGARRELAGFAPATAPPCKPLLERGDAVDGAFLVVGGSLRIFYLTPEGREATLYRVEPGGTCILALTATFNRSSYPAWVESGEEGCTFVVVPNPAFRRLFDGEPAFREFIFGVLSGRVFELMLALEAAGSGCGCSTGPGCSGSAPATGSPDRAAPLPEERDRPAVATGPGGAPPPRW